MGNTQSQGKRSGRFHPSRCGYPECYKLQTGADIITVQQRCIWESGSCPLLHRTKSL